MESHTSEIRGYRRKDEEMLFQHDNTKAIYLLYKTIVRRKPILNWRKQRQLKTQKCKAMLCVAHEDVYISNYLE